jgi:hypothetical protein
MDSSDIIEIGEDGTFEIPQTRTQSIPNTQFFHQGETLQNFPVSGQKEKHLTVLESIYPGEFKVFRNHASGALNLILHLKDNEIVKSVDVSRNIVLFQIDESKQLSVPLPVLVDVSSAISKSFQKYVTVQMKCL